MYIYIISYIVIYDIYMNTHTHTILYKVLAEKETEIMNTEKCHHLHFSDLGKLVVQSEG